MQQQQQPEASFNMTKTRTPRDSRRFRRQLAMMVLAVMGMMVAPNLQPTAHAFSSHQLSSRPFRHRYVAPGRAVTKLSLSTSTSTSSRWDKLRSRCWRWGSHHDHESSRSAVAFNHDNNTQRRQHKTSPMARFLRKRMLKVAAYAFLPLLFMPMKAVASTAEAVGTASDAALAGATAVNAVATTAAAPVVAAAGSVEAVATTATQAGQLMMMATSPISAEAEMRLIRRILYAAMMGACLGKERSFAKHSAGVRTMALVAMGASAYTVCSSYGFLAFDKYDASRMAANVASGVGFVGAGVITTTASDKSQINVVHGLTTAATIWLSAAVGVACGVGLFRIATAAAMTTIMILRLGRVKPTTGKKIRSAAKRASTSMSSSSTSSSTSSSSSAPLDASVSASGTGTSNEADQIDTDLAACVERDDAEIHDTSVWDEHHADHLEHIEESNEANRAMVEECQLASSNDTYVAISDVQAFNATMDDEDLVGTVIRDGTEDSNEKIREPESETVLLEVPKDVVQRLRSTDDDIEMAKIIEEAWRNSSQLPPPLKVIPSSTSSVKSPSPSRSSQPSSTTSSASTSDEIEHEQDGERVATAVETKPKAPRSEEQQQASATKKSSQYLP
mmetsp:Transcript_7087/g.20872  ORF Transcript_7087/g.20872 Transcript_7087/m.20872 type:complete len:619 (-) Transcript_7087:91-1947(-)